MKAVVCVPYRSDGAERERNWNYLDKWWDKTGFPVYVRDSDPDKPFERSVARNRAAEDAGDWDVVVFADADCLLASTDQVREAIVRCSQTGAYTAAHSELHYLSEVGTRDLILLKFPLSICQERDRPIGLTWESVFCVRRDIWEEVGGFDERFRGFGAQVIAFFHAAGTLGGRERIEGWVYHLDHPLVDRSQEPYFQDNLNLEAEYRAYVDNPEAMRAYLASRP